MKVVYWAPYVGHVGTIKAVINSAISMRRYGCHDVSLIKNHSEWEGHEDQIVSEGINIVDFGLKKWLPNLNKTGAFRSRLYMLVVSFIGFIQLWMYVRKHRPDIIIANLVVIPAILSVKASQSPSKIIVSIQGFPKFLGAGTDESYPNWMKVEDNVRKWLWNRVYKYADLLICMTQTTKNKLIKSTTLPGRSIEVVNNPVVDDDMLKMADKCIDDTWFIDGFSRRIVAIGRLTQQKDFMTLIDAVALIYKKMDLKVAVLGEGEEREMLQNVIKQRGVQDVVKLYGHLEKPYVYLKKSDVFVLTSKWEDPGHAIIEAAALKIPIVATNCPSGPADLLSNGKGGYLCDVGDAECVGKAVEIILNEASYIEKVDIAYVNAQNFTLESHYNALISAFKC
jgi:glycosyltransferase involved in cell wall biosynthesis